MTGHLLGRRHLLMGAPAALALAACRAPEDAKPAPPPSEARSVLQVVPAAPTSEGAGVRLGRTIGTRALAHLDPFLLLDEIKSSRPADYVRGFPEHPHRGFETVTIMIDGAMEHRDIVGNHGLLTGGSVQWMTAGSGIVHSEMPQQKDGLLWGFQLWVNLPKKLKMMKPRYQDIAPDRIPEVSVGGAATRVLAGAIGGTTGPVEDIVVAPTMLDVTIGAGSTFVHELPASHSAFAYVLAGGVRAGGDGRAVASRELAVLGQGATFVATASSEGARLLLVSAEPIGEPIARRGPFVMNTEAELDQAYEDYRAGRLVGG
jgi:redox-sensitive bicupin YhaK (pirin superfamily)